jgi:hypothetical protein
MGEFDKRRTEADCERQVRRARLWFRLQIAFGGLLVVAVVVFRWVGGTSETGAETGTGAGAGSAAGVFRWVVIGGLLTGTVGCGIVSMLVRQRALVRLRHDSQMLRQSLVSGQRSGQDADYDNDEDQPTEGAD